MSLKTFHVFFIVIAALLSLGFCAWTFLASGGVAQDMRAGGIASGVIGLALAGYGFWFVSVKYARMI